MPIKRDATRVEGGQYYGRVDDGPLVPVGDYGGPVDAWICRRVADFPAQQIPAGGAVGACARCHAAVVFNPMRACAAPKVCMQCMAIEPLPIEPRP